MKISPIVLLFTSMLIGCCIYFFWHFTLPVLSAAIMCFASWPLYEKWQNRVAHTPLLAPAGMLLAWLLLLFCPVIYLSIVTYQEAQGLLQAISVANNAGVGTPSWLVGLPWVGEQAHEYWSAHLAQPGQLEVWVRELLGGSWNDLSKTMLSFTADLAGFALSMLFCLITLFFLYKDGKRLLVQLDVIGNHLLSKYWYSMSRLIPKTVSATVVGMSTIAIAEGVILGVAYSIAGAPSPLVLGVITAFMAMIPGGAPLAFTSVSIFLIATGQTFNGTCLFVWGCVELFVIDKTIRPLLVGGPVKLPFLPTFFGLIGGVKTLGLLGLFIGPVLMALLVAVWRSWFAAVSEQVNVPENPNP